MRADRHEDGDGGPCSVAGRRASIERCTASGDVVVVVAAVLVWLWWWWKTWVQASTWRPGRHDTTPPTLHTTLDANTNNPEYTLYGSESVGWCRLLGPGHARNQSGHRHWLMRVQSSQHPSPSATTPGPAGPATDMKPFVQPSRPLHWLVMASSALSFPHYPWTRR